MRGILYSFLAGMFTDALTPDVEQRKKESYFHIKGKLQVFLKQEEQVAVCLTWTPVVYLHFFLFFSKSACDEFLLSKPHLQYACLQITTIASNKTPLKRRKE